MSQFINIKKLTANTLITAIVASSLVTTLNINEAFAARGGVPGRPEDTSSGSSDEGGPGCSNNGHGNNAPVTYNWNSGKLTIGHYDPSNPSGVQTSSLISALVAGTAGDIGSGANASYIDYQDGTSSPSYSMTIAEATDIINNHPDWELNGATTIHDCGSDYDNDGISDAVEIGSDVYNPLDINGDGVPDYAQKTLTLTGTLRDFSASHPDFERTRYVDGFDYGLDTGITTSDISSDRNPVYTGSSFSTTTQENFDQWYRDVDGVNERLEYSIDLYQMPNGLYRYENRSFFPLDGQLMGNQGYDDGNGNSHNYHFTFELHGQFTYQGGETLHFSGDDDVWVYINGKKVIDIGGVHGAITRNVDIDSIASSAGLVVGQTYDFDFFFAERHTTQSNFILETSIELLSDSDVNGIADIEEDAPTLPSSFVFPTGGSPDDIDGDGVPNSSDPDNDDNGVDDVYEDEPTLPSSFVFPTGGSPDDIDGDGVENSNDPDNDGNGIDDNIEGIDDIDGDGVSNLNDPDNDGNGIDDDIENNPTFPTGFVFPTGGSPDDIDGDGVLNSNDLDNDGNGIDDDIEDSPTLPTGFVFPTGGSPDDIDGDGVLNSNDPDNDGNGINDTEEDDPILPTGFVFPTGGSPDDIDGDGVLNSNDPDNDGNGINDVIEDNPTPTPPLPTIPHACLEPDGLPLFNQSINDIDGDGVLNSSDLNNDCDAFDDIEEEEDFDPDLNIYLPEYED